MMRQTIVVFVALCVAGPTTAEVVVLAPSMDNTLYEDSAGILSNGAGPGLFVGQNAAGDFARRALLAFDLTGQVPPGSHIHGATLTLHMSRTTSGPQIVYLHRVLARWGEGDSIADRGEGGGGGGDATDGDATWIHGVYPDHTWAQPGGDYEPAVSTACTISDVGFYTWEPAERMTADVQQWVNNPASNFGWILVGQEGQPGTSKRFDSREHEQAEYRPRLTIYYTPLAGGLPPMDADLNGDRRVDFGDVAVLAQQWMNEMETPAGSVAIAGVGVFGYDPAQIRTLRPDIFQPGHFSAFDVLAHLDEQGQIDMDYHYDKFLATHVIDSINGVENWWYRAHYDGGRLIDLVTRMDLYPCKDRMEISIEQIDEARLNHIYASFAAEVVRRTANGGQVILPEVTILGKTFEATFTDVLVKPHNLRIDTFQKDVVTALDVVLSLADEGKLTCDLRWYESIGAAHVVRSFYLKRINEDAGTESSGFQYETGADKSFGTANRISMPSDWRVLVSPTYLRWNWVSLD